MVNDVIYKEAAFTEVYQQYSDLLFKIAFRYTKVKVDADDIVQDVFMKVWEKWSPLSGIENVEGYLIRMTCNQSINHLRKQARDRKKVVEGRIYGHYIEDSLLEKECKEIHKAAFNKLTTKQKEVYLLRYLGVTRNQMGNKLKISKNTIDNQMSEALKKVKGYVCRYLAIRNMEEKGILDRLVKPAIAA